MDSWQKRLTAALRNSSKTAILGVGNDIKADDGVGPYVVKQLQGRLPDTIELINASTVPENFLGHLCDMQPSLVLIIDAALMNANPGAIRLIDKSTIHGVAFSTHQLPLTFFIEYLTSQISTTVLILGIQPKTDEFNQPLSPPVRAAACRIADTLSRVLRKPRRRRVRKVL
jgi:hydrogenase 3 maturation protease